MLVKLSYAYYRVLAIVSVVFYGICAYNLVANNTFNFTTFAGATIFWYWVSIAEPEDDMKYVKSNYRNTRLRKLVDLINILFVLIIVVANIIK